MITVKVVILDTQREIFRSDHVDFRPEVGEIIETPREVYKVVRVRHHWCNSLTGLAYTDRFVDVVPYEREQVN